MSGMDTNKRKKGAKPACVSILTQRGRVVNDLDASSRTRQEGYAWNGERKIEPERKARNRQPEREFQRIADHDVLALLFMATYDSRFIMSIMQCMRKQRGGKHVTFAASKAYLLIEARSSGFSS